jgi:hypothetical protein
MDDDPREPLAALALVGLMLAALTVLAIRALVGLGFR